MINEKEIVIILFENKASNGFLTRHIITNITNREKNGLKNVSFGQSLIPVYFFTAFIFNSIITKKAQPEPIIAPPIFNDGTGTRIKFAISFIVIPTRE